MFIKFSASRLPITITYNFLSRLSGKRVKRKITKERKDLSSVIFFQWKITVCSQLFHVSMWPYFLNGLTNFHRSRLSNRLYNRYRGLNKKRGNLTAKIVSRKMLANGRWWKLAVRDARYRKRIIIFRVEFSWSKKKGGEIVRAPRERCGGGENTFFPQRCEGKEGRKDT